MGKGGGGGPSLAEMEASQRRIMTEQMTLSTRAQIDAEDRLKVQREADRLAEKERLKTAKLEEADKLKEQSRQETETVKELMGESPTSGSDIPNLSTPQIEEPDYGSDEVRPT